MDDHEVVRCGVRSLLSEAQHFEVCGDAIDGQDAVVKAKELKPDVVVMDVSMPKLNGLEATRQIRDALPQTEVLILSQHEAPEMIRQAYSAGARGYLVKSALSASLLAAVERVSRHEPFFADLQKSEAHLDVHEVLQRSAAFEAALRESEERVQNRTRELEAKNLELVRQTEVVRELSARLLQIQDEERRRIARELHDSVGQMLAAVSMNLSQVNREVQALTPPSARALEDNIGMVEQISTEIRTISHLLHPPLLDEVGLQSALRWFIEGFCERSKINVDLELPDDFGRLPRNLEITLFRVVQECLTNIHRHSGSSTAAIRVARSEKEVRLEVRDAGKGIPADTQNSLAAGKLAGVGLRGMSERLRQMGGQLQVTSNGTGTQVLATLPIEAANPQETTTTANSAQ